jgi:hypothetical protein
MRLLQCFMHCNNCWPVVAATGAACSYSNSPYTLDTRAEVALLDSNINVAPADGTAQYGPSGNKFGPRLLAAGNSTCQLANIQISYCGQAGLTRACVQFQGCECCF